MLQMRTVLTSLGVLDLSGANAGQPHAFNSVVLNKFCLCPGVKKLAGAVYISTAYFFHIVCHSLKLSLGFKKLSDLHTLSAPIH